MARTTRALGAGKPIAFSERSAPNINCAHACRTFSGEELCMCYEDSDAATQFCTYGIPDPGGY